MDLPESSPNPDTEQAATDERSLLRVVASLIREYWRLRGPSSTLWYCLRLFKEFIFSNYFLVSILCGAGAGILLVFGQGYAIGFHSAWKIYGRWWVLSPLYGPWLLVTMVVMFSLFDEGERFIKRIAPRLATFVGISLAILSMGTLILIGAYFGTREDNPVLISQPANLEALSKSVGDQSRVLSNLSESGKNLLAQLNSTEIELEAAKKQLAATLGNFDAQRKAAGEVTEELKRIDTRQKQIALQTEELERILEGQQPITRHDLQRANMQGLFSGLLGGFLTSLLATVAYNAFRKHRMVST